MQVTCPQCATRLQLSAPKLPNHPFTIKCPKCAQGITVTPAANGPQPNAPEMMPPPVTAPEVHHHSEPFPAPSAPLPPPPPESSLLESVLETPPPLPAPRPSSDLPAAETNAAMGWTNSMPSPTVSEDSKTLFTGQGANHDLLQALTALLTANGMTQQTARIEQRKPGGAWWPAWQIRKRCGAYRKS
ncbi:MAG: zinc-ribbon domain-containing protein [Blastocatellia bacterium]